MKVPYVSCFETPGTKLETTKFETDGDKVRNDKVRTDVLGNAVTQLRICKSKINIILLTLIVQKQ